MSYYVVATLIETPMDLRGPALSSTRGFGFERTANVRGVGTGQRVRDHDG